jgi:PAS domain S-box-containing protein
MAKQMKHPGHHPTPAESPKPRILLVDDTPSTLVALLAILDAPEYDLVDARSGEEALEWLKSEEFAVVLLDVRMPGMRGFDAAKHIRADDRSQHTPIIFLTADDISREQTERGYALGAVDFFTKPLSPVIIQAKVRGFVRLFQEKQKARHEVDQLRLMVQGTTDYAIFMLDPQGRVLTWNTGAERFKGYKAEEIIGQHFSKFYPQEALDRCWPDHELKVATAEGRFEDEGWRVRKDGTQFWANVVITALRDEKGELRGFSKVTRDLTERMQTEEALRRSEERFRHMVEGVQDYAIFMLDQHGNVATWNAGAERIKQYKADEIIGLHFSKFYPKDLLDRRWPEHELQVATAEGRFEDEGWRIRKDGSQFWANVVITALKDGGGKLLGFSKITRDMTDRKRGEEDARRLVEETTARRIAEENARLMQEQRERLHVTLASIGDAVISTDAEGRVELLNPVAQELVGWSGAEAKGRMLTDVFQIVNEDTRLPVDNPALRALKEGKIVGLANHTVLISKNGTERPIDDSAAPIRNQQGDLAGSVLVFRDISERKQSESLLRERLRLLALNARVGAALVQGNDLAAMLQQCAEGLVEHLDAAFARIWTLNDEDNVLELRASAGMYTHLDGPHSLVPVGKYKIGLIAQEKKPHLTNEVVGDPRVSDQEWAKREGMVAFAGYPLVVDDRLVGVMAIFARKALSQATLEAMSSVADEIAVGIERKTTHERLHEQREWLSVTLASIGDAVITTDDEGRVTFLNAVAQEMTGWTLNEAEGQELSLIFPVINEQSRRPVTNPVEKVLREVVIVGLANHTLLIAKDGTERPIDDSAAPIRDASGKMLGVVLIFRDVTEQRRAERELRESEARKSAVLRTALDCIITMDHEGRVVEFNPAAEKTFGYRREEIVGQELCEYIIPTGLRELHRQGLANYLANGEGPVLGRRLELSALRADGSKFPVELAITRNSEDDPPVFTAYLRDMSEAKRSERNRNVRNAVTQALSEAVTVKDGAIRVLGAICSGLDWDVGFLWRVADSGDRLTCAQSWHKPEVLATEFEQSSCNRTFAKGDGLPGRIWATGQSEWILDVLTHPKFPRAASASQYDLHSAFGCPVVVGDRMVGVIEFFTKRISEPDADLLEMMGTIAGSIGQFLERQEAEDELRRSEAELSDFFENATVGLHWVGPDGIILRANRTELTLLGYSREEYVGRPITDFHADKDVICDILNRLQAGQELHEYPARLKCKDGSIKDVLIDSSVLFRGEDFVHTRCFTRDVTENKRAAKELHEQQQRTHAILESITDAFCTFDSDWRFVYVNQQAEVLLSRSRSDLLGKNHWDEYPDMRGTEVERNYRRAVAEQVAIDFEFFFPPHERWYELRAYPSTDGLSVYFRDVSQRRRAEDALKESEEKLRLLANTIPQLAWMAKPDGDIFWYNHRWYEYTGTTPEQMEGWGWQAVHDPDVLPNVVERWKESITTGEPFDMVFPLKGADGQFHPFLTRVNPLRDEHGSILYWFGTNTDITELRETREALATSEERLRLALDAGRMGVWDWNIRTGDLKWSDSLEPLHGLAPGTFGGTFDHFQQLIYTEDRGLVNAAIQQALESSGEFYVEFRNVWSNGGIHWIAGSGKVFPGEDGQPLRMIGIGLDVTQRKRSEQTARFLADASAALAVLVDFDSTLQKVASLAVPSFADWATVDLVEPDGSLRRVSVSHIDPAKVQLAHDVHNRFPPDPAAPQGVWTILRTGRSEIVPEITDELLVQSIRDAELLRIMRELGLKSYIGVPLSVRGKTLGVITFINAESGHEYNQIDLAVAEDLASRAAIAIENAQLYRELREADQRKDEFLATLAHELRNPLAPIRNGLQVLKLAGGSAEMVNETRTMMERQLGQMVRLVDDLLDVSRITRNKLDLKKERITLASVIHSASETSRPLMEQFGHTFSITLPPSPVYLDADLTRLAQVFSNLLNNSAKYTEPGGRISLTGEVDGGEVVVRVRDTGLGIPADALPRIFEMFSQVDRNMERAQGGLGIGLTLVRRLVEMHEGTVEARSDGPGRGSEFIVRLPILKELSQPSSVSAIDQAATTNAKRRILVVDDNHDSAMSLGMMLKLMGNDIQTAHDGLAAAEAAEQFRPDVILLDIGLPKLNGYEACRRIRDQSWSEETVIVALTGWGQEEDRRQSKEAGFDHHLVKPVDVDALQLILAKRP